MSSPPSGSPVNGHVIKEEAFSSTAIPERHRSASDTQNGIDDSVRQPSPDQTPTATEDAPGEIVDDIVMHQTTSSDEDASHDADYEMHATPGSNHDDGDDDEVLLDRASSTDSNRASKRKAPVDEDDFIRANPELYGLRRSV